ncbi:hypothetical protein ACNKHR_26080 [Shigella flexneri]
MGSKVIARFMRRPRSTASRLKSKTYRRNSVTSLADQRRSAGTGKQAVQIEKHYGRPMDIEWRKMATPANCSLCRCCPQAARSRGQVMERYTLH